MGHHISAIVLKGDAAPEAVTQFDAKLVDCPDGFSLVALDENYVDAWADRLDIHLSLIHIPSPRDRTRSRMPSSA